MDVVEETRLLGVVIRSDLKWSSNTADIVKRAYKKLWCLKRLKNYGATQLDLLDVYFKQIRSIVEYAAPVWHSSLTGDERINIERVQKSALSIVLGHNYKSYRYALKTCKLKTLYERRRQLCKKLQKSHKSTPSFLSGSNQERIFMELEVTNSFIVSTVRRPDIKRVA